MILPLIAGMTIGYFGASCNREKERKDTSSLPEEVRPIADAIIDDSPTKFAAVVSYPMERPYPLKNVKDSAEMVKYYPKIVDKTLKKAVEEAPDSVWQNQGWRGWTLSNGSYFWIDDGKIYAMSYVSKEENTMLDSLRNEEISTLEPSMQAGWSPVLCVIDTVSNAIFRIDSQEDTNPPIYRLAGYADTTDLSASPNIILYGHLDLEGTMGNRFYEFTDSIGDVTAHYAPDAVSDEEEPVIEVDTKGNMKKYPAKPDYWLDHVRIRKGNRNFVRHGRDNASSVENSQVRTLKVDQLSSDSTDINLPDSVDNEQ